MNVWERLRGLVSHEDRSMIGGMYYINWECEGSGGLGIGLGMWEEWCLGQVLGYKWIDVLTAWMVWGIGEVYDDISDDWCLWMANVGYLSKIIAAE